METEATIEFENSNSIQTTHHASENEALLLDQRNPCRVKKPFYRARPLWLVPFAITAAVVRGMTLAPRIEIYTQLACNKLLKHDPYPHSQLPAAMARIISAPSELPFHGVHLRHDLAATYVSATNMVEEDPRRLPSAQCISDPKVQAGAARLQTMMTSTMGFLSALTTGWWGHFSERHGRTTVLAISTFGLLMTDLIFILASTPSSPLSSHGHIFILFAPVIEGLLGGWSTLQSATSSYLSDCTSSGSRASIFSKFSGVFYVGLSVGPILGGCFIRHPLFVHSEADGIPTVTSVFWVAIFCSLVNFVLVLFVFPESLDKGRRKGKGTESFQGTEASTGNITIRGGQRSGVLSKFLRPLRLFLPEVVWDRDLRKRRDCTLTLLAIMAFGYTLAQGVYQLKYLYAGHIYGWGAEQLSYYISFLGITKVVFLLLILPWIISTIKPKRSQTNSRVGLSNVHGKKSAIARADLAGDVSFDIHLIRFSIFLDFMSNTLVVFSPLPSYTPHGHPSKGTSEAFFVAATSLSSLGSGANPALHSLALSILQTRVLNKASIDQTDKGKGVGDLFGALAILNAVGQTILGPLLFGMIYSESVRDFPQAIFATAAGILLFSLILTTFIRLPFMRTSDSSGGDEGNLEHVSKDLRNGVASYGSIRLERELEDSSAAGPSSMDEIL